MDLTSVRKIFACKWRHAGACSDPRTRGAGHRELGHVSASRIGECDVSSRTAGFLDNCGVLDKPWGEPTVFSGTVGILSSTNSPQQLETQANSGGGWSRQCVHTQLWALAANTWLE